jgi:hypothetical protein
LEIVDPTWQDTADPEEEKLKEEWEEQYMVRSEEPLWEIIKCPDQSCKVVRSGAVSALEQSVST